MVSSPGNKTMKDNTATHKFVSPVDELDYPQKINIHMVLRGEILDYALRCNELISSTTFNEVDFSFDSFHVPHVTFYMGFVQNKDSLTKLMQDIGNWASTTPPRLQLNFSQPYLKKPQNRWCFVDVLPVDKFIEIKKHVRMIADPYLHPLSWDVVSEPPHITVGYIKQDSQKIENKLSAFLSPQHIHANIPAVGISFSGGRGCCLGTIRQYDIF
jgi:2'-5' RNA ligase